IEVLGFDGYEETNYPLVTEVSLEPISQQLQLGLSCRTSDLDAREAERFATYLVRALTAAAADLASWHDAPLLSSTEQHQILTEWGGLGGEPQTKGTLHSCF